MNLALAVAGRNTSSAMVNRIIMKNTSLYTTLILCFTLQMGVAQISITEEPAISRVMNDFQFQNQQSQTVSGWRIMIISTNDRRKSEAAKLKFDAMHPDMVSNWEQDVPFYKVTVGAFENKDALQGLLIELKREFSSAIPVVDQIRKTELVP